MTQYQPNSRPNTSELLETFDEIFDMEKLVAYPLDQNAPYEKLDSECFKVIFGEESETEKDLLSLVTKMRNCYWIDDEKFKELNVALTYKLTELSFKREMEIHKNFDNKEKIKSEIESLTNEYKKVSNYLIYR